MTQRVTEKQKANLIPLTKRSESEAKAIRSKGALCATAVKNEKKTLRKLIEQMGSMPATETEKSMFKNLFPGMKDEEITKDMMLVASAYNQAVGRGNIKAMSFIRDTKGEKPETTINGSIVSEKVFITPEQQKAVEQHIVEVLSDDGHGD
jgi:hypothetical protein